MVTTNEPVKLKHDFQLQNQCKSKQKYNLYLVTILLILVLVMNTEIIFYIVWNKANGIIKNQDT